MLAQLILKRMAFLVVVALGVTLITFTISHVVPGDPARLIAGPRATPEMVENIREDLGLNESLPAQYVTYLGDILRGDLGTSILTNRPVLDEILTRLPATLELMLVAFVISVSLGVVLGVTAAVNHNRWPDHLIRAVSVVGVSTPSFWLGILLIILLYGQLGIFPASGRMSDVINPPDSITGLYLIDALLTLNVAAFSDALRHLFIPAITISLVSIGGIIRIIRSSMLEVLSEDYVRVATALGVPRKVVVYNLALRNALIPFVTVVGLSFAELLYGSIIIETIFAWPGTGTFVVNAILNLDFPVIIGFALLTSIFYVTVNLVVDLIYMRLDPRIGAIG